MGNNFCKRNGKQARNEEGVDEEVLDAVARIRTESVFKVVLQKSTPPQIRPLILYYHQYKEQVDGFVWELIFAKGL